MSRPTLDKYIGLLETKNLIKIERNNRITKENKVQKSVNIYSFGEIIIEFLHGGVVKDLNQGWLKDLTRGGKDLLPGVVKGFNCNNISVNNINLNNKNKKEIFDKFWSIYPKKKNYNQCLDMWLKNNLDKIFQEIISNVQERVKHDQGWKDGYVHNSVTYLQNEIWKEVFKSTIKPKGIDANGKFNAALYLLQDLREESVSENENNLLIKTTRYLE